MAGATLISGTSRPVPCMAATPVQLAGLTLDDATTLSDLTDANPRDVLSFGALENNDGLFRGGLFVAGESFPR